MKTIQEFKALWAPRNILFEDAYALAFGPDGERVVVYTRDKEIAPIADSPNLQRMFDENINQVRAQVIAEESDRAALVALIEADGASNMDSVNAALDSALS